MPDTPKGTQYIACRLTATDWIVYYTYTGMVLLLCQLTFFSKVLVQLDPAKAVPERVNAEQLVLVLNGAVVLLLTNPVRRRLVMGLVELFAVYMAR